MWLSKKMREQFAARTVGTGRVTSGGERARVVGEREYICTAAVHPYGVYAPIPQEARAVVLEGLCLGVTDAWTGLEEGEICLRSKGGASIVLRNSGAVEINGQVFPKQEA